MEDSVILTIFGATGDLVRKKIIPALYTLYEEEKLPSKIKILGFARRDFTGGKYNNFINESLHKILKVDDPNPGFYDLFEYVQGDLDNDEGFKKLEEAIKKHDEICRENCVKLFYYSIQQSFYEPVTEQIAKFDMPKDNFRLLIEKPYGHDTQSASELDQKMKHHFEEDQLYRIDHYMHKKIVRQILDFRFENSIIKSVWKPSEINKVVISTKEDFGAEGRGAFYDALGALKDVGQNHLLAIASLILMEEFKDESSEHFIERRAKALQSFKPFENDEQIKENTFRAQYQGYKEIENVDPDSTRETYFKVKLFSSKEGWGEIPFILEAGKKLDKHMKEVKVYFETNVIFFEFHPNDQICIGLHSNEEKETCLYKMENESRKYQYVSEYALVIEEAIQGKRDFFVSINEVLAQWSIVDSIEDGWMRDLVPLVEYEQGTTPRSDIN